MAKLRIRPQRAQERFLEGILRAVSAEPPDEEREDLVAMLLVETFERWQGHTAF